MHWVAWLFFSDRPIVIIPGAPWADEMCLFFFFVLLGGVKMIYCSSAICAQCLVQGNSIVLCVLFMSCLLNVAPGEPLRVILTFEMQRWAAEMMCLGAYTQVEAAFGKCSLHLFLISRRKRKTGTSRAHSGQYLPKSRRLWLSMSSIRLASSCRSQASHCIEGPRKWCKRSEKK